MPNHQANRRAARVAGASAALIAGVILLTTGSPAHAQVSTPATPRVGSPTVPERIGPPAPPAVPNLPLLAPRDGPLPSSLTLAQALEEAEARSPAVIAARARVEAAEARIRQAGFRSNPELSLEVENFLGTGELSGFRGIETTLAVNQRLDLPRTENDGCEALGLTSQTTRSCCAPILALLVRMIAEEE